MIYTLIFNLYLVLQLHASRRHAHWLSSVRKFGPAQQRLGMHATTPAVCVVLTHFHVVAGEL